MESAHCGPQGPQLPVPSSELSPLLCPQRSLRSARVPFLNLTAAIRHMHSCFLCPECFFLTSHLTCTFTSFRSLLKCHLIREAFPSLTTNTRFSAALSPYPWFFLLGLITAELTDIHRMYAYQPHPLHGLLEDKRFVTLSALSPAPKTVPGT